MSISHTDHSQVQDYYSRILKSNKDLKTNACCPVDAMPRSLRDIAAQINGEIIEKFYGCGSPIPPAIEGCTVLDLGCGTGRDAFICSKLVGERGRVIGLDMTEEQLEVARRHVDSQCRAFGLAKPNVEFMQGYMEDLAAVGIADESVDVVISNCVINLAPDKERVFSEILRVLRPGGEILFSDVFADRRLPASWREDPVLLGECLGGAMYVEDFRRLMARLGVPDHRVTAQRRIALENEAIEQKIGPVQFHSITVRAFKLASLEDRCEDYGQVATYRGTIPGAPHSFVLDDHHEFFTGKPMLVCGNTATMVEETRFASHFQVTGDRSVHHGLFPCGPAQAPDSTGSDCGPDCC
jgi:arsenite methyltransferase